MLKQDSRDDLVQRQTVLIVTKRDLTFDIVDASLLNCHLKFLQEVYVRIHYGLKVASFVRVGCLVELTCTA